MSRWIVLEPPGGTDERPSDRARFVRDRFAGWAVLFPFLWLFRHGLILAGLLVAALWFAFGLLAGIPGFGLAATVLPLLLGCLVALEGPSLRAAKLRRKGLRDAAVVEADEEADAAILYYAAESSHLSAASGSAFASPAPTRRASSFRSATLLDPPGRAP